MDWRNNGSTFLLALILIALGGVALLEQGSLVVLLLLGLLFLVRQFDTDDYSSSTSSDFQYDTYEEVDTYREQRPANMEPVYRHALEAVTRAGLNPDNVQVLAVDLGVMAYHDDGEKQLFRTWALPEKVKYIQPFVELRVPTKANGRIRFEVLDAQGVPIFVHEDNHNLNRGRNTVMPSTRLPIHDEQEKAQSWQLRVTADDVLLAVHHFEFSDEAQSSIRKHIGEDGEINTELRSVMAESRLPQMSLDDLLAYQEEEDASQASS